MTIVFLLVFCVFILIFIKLRFINWMKIQNMFTHLSIVVCGKRGSGKDTLMSAVAYHKNHNSNVQLQKNTNIINLHQMMLPDNFTRQGLTNGIHYDLDYEKYSIFQNMTFVSDAQVYFPSWDDSNLKKEYKSLPVVYALWRHLYNAPLHWNTQNIERLYKILREQLDDCIMCLGTLWLPLHICMKVRYYERAKDCVEGLKPLSVGFLKKGNPDYKIEQSKRWEIKDYILVIPRWKVQHDTRYFKRIIFKEDAEGVKKHNSLFKKRRGVIGGDATLK